MGGSRIKHLILTPETWTYGFAITVSYALGSVALASHIQMRWLGGRWLSFWVIRAAIMTFAVCCGFVLFGPTAVLGEPRLDWILLAVGGLAGGWIALHLDRVIVRHFERSAFAKKSKAGSARALEFRNLQIRNVISPSRPGVAENVGFTLMPVLITAVLEELVYRGVLVKSCFALPNGVLVVAALTVTCLAFALNHIGFGWPHILAKLPLSVLALAATLISGTVFPAILAHAAFNAAIWKSHQAGRLYAAR
jgi:hypothetical protein